MEASDSPLPRLLPEVGGPWSRWPDPSKGGAVARTSSAPHGQRPLDRTVRPVKLKPHDPLSIATEVTRYAARLREAQRPGECITVSAAQVRAAIWPRQTDGLAAGELRAIEQLCWATLLVLGFEPGTRGNNPTTRQKNNVLRLPAAVHASAARASPSSAVLEPVQPTSTEPVELDHTGPNGTARTQRWLTAEKRARSGYTAT